MQAGELPLAHAHSDYARKSRPSGSGRVAALGIDLAADDSKKAAAAGAISSADGPSKRDACCRMDPD